ncbi:GIY-YIG nuclease family protein [Candidatus Saganbacteria bacterium]|nr:GIY-YIG nuclease family protein [Candidatus Saganbacteria bacterium]
MFYIYILENDVNKHYIGYTSKDPIERLEEHNRSKGNWTRYKGPWKLVYQESFLTKEEASRREKQIKNYKGGQAFKKLVINI